MVARWHGAVIAESSSTIRLEGNAYFPRDDVNHEYLVESRTHTICPWKGRASYYTMVVDGKANEDAAWCYPHPSPLAGRIKNHIAFSRGVEV